MAQATSIEWTDYSASLLKYRDNTGKTVWACEKVSDGCKHCYSETLAHRYQRGKPFTAANMKLVEPYFDEAEAKKLLRSKKLAGKRVFVDDMTDLFGSWVSNEIIDGHFAVFALRPDVTFQVLTKRPERMAEYFQCRSWGDVIANVRSLADHRDPPRWAAAFRGMYEWDDQRAGTHGDALEMSPTVRENLRPAVLPQAWPLPNVWLGTSIENQATADERLPHLLQCPAAVIFLSCEPLLGPIEYIPNMRMRRCRTRHHPRWYMGGKMFGDCYCPQCGWSGDECKKIDWCIVGGESGSGARPCDVAWIMSIVAQCKAAGVPCFVKQLGARPISPIPQCPIDCHCGLHCGFHDRKGGDISEFPSDLRVRELPVVTPAPPRAGEGQP